MPIYVYETVPATPGARPRRFEVRQRMADAPLTRDPETGEPIRRVIVGGLEIPRGPADRPAAPTPRAHGPGCSCCG